MDIKDLFRQIHSGIWDDHLTEIASTAQERVRVIGIIDAAGVAIGDRVRVRDNIRPLSLVGLEGVVVSKTSRAVTVQLEIASQYTRMKLSRYLSPTNEIKLRPGTFVRV